MHSCTKNACLASLTLTGADVHRGVGVGQMRTGGVGEKMVIFADVLYERPLSPYLDLTSFAAASAAAQKTIKCAECRHHA